MFSFWIGLTVLCIMFLALMVLDEKVFCEAPSIFSFIFIIVTFALFFTSLISDGDIKNIVSDETDIYSLDTGEVFLVGYGQLKGSPNYFVFSENGTVLETFAVNETILTSAKVTQAIAIRTHEVRYVFRKNLLMGWFFERTETYEEHKPTELILPIGYVISEYLEIR